jgi:hypothetical protein
MSDKLELFTSVPIGIMKYQGSNKIRKIFILKPKSSGTGCMRENANPGGTLSV